MMSISKSLADENFFVVIDGETKSYKIVPQMSSTLRKNLVFWQTEKNDEEDFSKNFYLTCLNQELPLVHLTVFWRVQI